MTAPISNSAEFHHFSVMRQEVIACFNDKNIRIFVDGTLGAGGHAEAILKAHPEIESFIGFDQDPTAIAIAVKRLEPWSKKVSIIPKNFENLQKELQRLGTPLVDGILLDLGVSSMQLDQAERGFSFMRTGPLDMRMDPEAFQSAADVINNMSEKELGRIFRDYGEERHWRAAARAIVSARAKRPLETTSDLVDVLMPVLRGRHKKGINPLTLIFQGLRIYVNRELEVLESVIPQAIDSLAKEGRLAVISFHSLEDRIVKNALRFAASDKYDTSGVGGVFLDKVPLINLVTRKPIVPSEKEIQDNPRSRSAKLRVVERR